MPTQTDRPRARRYVQLPGSELGLALAAMAARAARRDLETTPASDDEHGSPPGETERR